MKISKSKQELARIISENGGWRDGEWFMANKIKNHHQTVLSSDEYFHLYPAPDADGWIEWNGGKCPVDNYKIVDLRMRGGELILEVLAWFFRWSNSGLATT